MGILDQIGAGVVRHPTTRNVTVIAFSGTTAANGDLTLGAGMSDMQASVTRSGNNYIIDVGSFNALLSCIARSPATVSSGQTVNAGLGTVQVNFGSLQASTSLNFVLTVDTGAWR
jgi:hypothetical protein